jgi:hypothetical protein
MAGNPPQGHPESPLGTDSATSIPQKVYRAQIDPLMAQVHNERQRRRDILQQIKDAQTQNLQLIRLLREAFDSRWQFEAPPDYPPDTHLSHEQFRADTERATAELSDERERNQNALQQLRDSQLQAVRLTDMLREEQLREEALVRRQGGSLARQPMESLLST